MLNKKSSLYQNKNVGLNYTRTGFYEISKKPKCKIDDLLNIKKDNNEIKGDISCQKLSKLKPLKTHASICIQEQLMSIYCFFVIAALTKGVSVFNGISDLANKRKSHQEHMK